MAATWGNMVMCKLKGWMDNVGIMMEIKGWMQKGAIRCAN